MPDEARDYLKLVRDNTVQMGQLVDDLLAFSRLGRKPLNKQQVPTGADRRAGSCTTRASKPKAVA